MAGVRLRPRRDEHRQHVPSREKRSTTGRSASSRSSKETTCRTPPTVSAATATETSRQSRAGTWGSSPRAFGPSRRSGGGRGSRGLQLRFLENLPRAHAPQVRLREGKQRDPAVHGKDPRDARGTRGGLPRFFPKPLRRAKRRFLRAKRGARAAPGDVARVAAVVFRLRGAASGKRRGGPREKKADGLRKPPLRYEKPRDGNRREKGGGGRLLGNRQGEKDIRRPLHLQARLRNLAEPSPEWAEGLSVSCSS